MKHDSTRWIVFGGFLLVAFTIVVILIDARNEQYYNLKQKFQDLLEKTFPKGVDLVYLWTHPSSTKYFLELLRWYQNELIGRKELLENITIIHRVSDYFRFFVRSYSEYLQWIRRVYIVIPDLEESSTFFIRNGTHFYIIPHKQLIPSRYLPTFNPRVVEWYLHRLPHISEEFIVIKQDAFLLHHLLPTHFKDPSLGFYKIPIRSYNQNPPSENPYQLSSTRHTLALLGLSEGLSIDLQAPLLFNRSVIFELESVFHGAIEETKKHRFPSINDVQLPILYIHFLLLQEYKFRVQTNIENALRRWDNNGDGLLSDDELLKHTNLRWSDFGHILGANISLIGPLEITTILSNKDILHELIGLALLPLPYRHMLHTIPMMEIRPLSKQVQTLLQSNSKLTNPESTTMAYIEFLNYNFQRLLKAKKASGTTLSMDTSLQIPQQSLLYLSPAILTGQNVALRETVERFFFAYYPTPSQFEQDVHSFYVISLVAAFYIIVLFIGCCYTISYCMGVTTRSQHNTNKNV